MTFWEEIEAEAPSLDEVFPKDYEDILEPQETRIGRMDMSPIEEKFYEAWCKRIKVFALRAHLFYLKPQHAIGRYRADFAHLKTHTAIELLGQATHSSTAAIAYDCKRQREIEALGWRVVRFGGREVFTDVEAVVDEVGHILIEQMVQKGQVRIVREHTGIVRENTTLPEKQEEQVQV